jgi:NDP-sugar pyrophosphorylase family protein
MGLDLVILAAGMGSRYGGLKQLDPMGPQGAFLLEYGLYDAIRAGFDHLIFVIRRDMEAIFTEKLLARLGKGVRVSVVFQSLEDRPGAQLLPFERKKPWGTGHALWSARRVIEQPFGVINADDFYGRTAFVALAEALKSSYVMDHLSVGHYYLVGYRLGNTLSEHGTVSRGICSVSTEGFLEQVVEHTRISRASDGRILSEFPVEQCLPESAFTSLNLFGFTPDFIDHLDTGIQGFFQKKDLSPTSEYFLPSEVNRLMNEGRVTVNVIPTSEQWRGVTYPADKAAVEAFLINKTQLGDYPICLW